MLFVALVLLALAVPSQQGSTYRLLKQYGEQKLNEACYGFEAQRIWKYHFHQAEKKCKAQGYKITGDYLPFMPSSSHAHPHQGQGSKPYYSKYEQTVYSPRPNPGPTSTVTLYPSTQYYPYQQQQIPQHLAPSSTSNLASFIQALNLRQLSPVAVRVPHDGLNKKYVYQRGETYPTASQYTHPVAAFKTPVEHTASQDTYNKFSTSQDVFKANNNAAAFYALSGYPSVYSRPQARRFKREAVHMSRPNEQQLQEFERQFLDYERADKESEIQGTRCVMQEMGYLTDDDQVDLKYAKEEIRALNIAPQLKQDLLDTMDGCYEMSMNLPEPILRHLPVQGMLAKSLWYFKCNDKMSTKVCLKNEITATKSTYKQFDLKSSSANQQ